MTTRIGFYHLQLWPLEKALPALLEKVFGGGYRAVVMAGSPERVTYLDGLLWTYDPASWLPHGMTGNGEEAGRHPIWLTALDENPNQANVLVLIDGMGSDHLADFARVLVLFDGNDPDALHTARRQWKAWKDAGFELVYHQQTERGGWVEKARAGGETGEASD